MRRSHGKRIANDLEWALGTARQAPVADSANSIATAIAKGQLTRERCCDGKARFTTYDYAERVGRENGAEFGKAFRAAEEQTQAVAIAVAPDYGEGGVSDVIIGGETPFFSPSEALLHAPEKPTRFSKDGVDHTRLLNLGLLAAAWYRTITTGELTTFGEEPREFMRGMIASANTGLQRLGIAPLISIAEVERIAPQFAEGK